MKPQFASPRAFARALAAALALLAGGAATASAADPVTSNFDARPESADPAPPPGGAAREQLRDRLGRLGTLSLDPRTDTVRAVGRLNGFLTGASGRDGADVALGYVRDNAAALGIDAADVEGLRLVSRSFADGVEHLRWEQRYRGLPVADAGLDAAVTGAGRLVGVTGPPAHDVAVRSTAPAIGASEAYSAARDSADAGGATPSVASVGGGPEQETRFRGGGSASLAVYRSGDGYRLGWKVLAPVSSTGVYNVTVDARDGTVVQRANLVKFAVNAKVFRNNPATGAQETVDFAPWLSSTTALKGPNAHAFLDLGDVVKFPSLTPPASGAVPPSSPGNYDYPLTFAPSWGAMNDTDGCPDVSTTAPSRACTWNADPTATGPTAWAANQRQSAAQLFYLVNAFHDHLRDDPNISFGDDEGAFAGNDAILAQAMDGADGPSRLPDPGHVNNSNFLTLPDGQPGLMQMYLWKVPFGGYDGANDAAMVWHEYTHGMTDRFVHDAQGYSALTTAQAGAISEGLSDWYAMDWVVGSGLQTDGPGADVRFGKYFDNENAGSSVRFQSLDCPTGASSNFQCRSGTGGADAGGFTFGDFGEIDSAGPEVHADGEIMAETLWQLRQALVAEYNAAGAERARQYVTGALRLVPDEPSFLDLRNAILQASTEDDALIWQVFTNRGMGYFASSDDSTDTAPLEDFTDPDDLTGSATLTGRVTDENDAPVAGATVAVSGHDSGLGPNLVSLPTGANGQYQINGLPVRATGSTVYRVVRAEKPAYAAGSAGVTFPQGSTTRDLPLQVERDFSSDHGTASVRSYTGPDNTKSGCGPHGAVDDSPSTVWGTTRVAGGQSMVIDMGVPIDVGRVAIDPSAGCGDDASAALGQYEVLGSTGPDGPFTSIRAGTLTAANSGKLNDVYTGTVQGVRYVRLRAIAPQSSNGDGASFVDVAELHVGRSPGSLLGPSVTTGAAAGVGTGSAVARGTVVTHDQPAQVHVEYGTTTAYGRTASAGSAAAGNAIRSVSASLTGLTPRTTYHYRMVAVVGSDRYPGSDTTFRTAAVTPPPTATPTPTPPDGDDTTPAETLTALVDTKLKATRKGMVKVRVSFGNKAPAGSARLRILGRRSKPIAEGLLTVRAGRTATKTIRLSKRGRKEIRPGRTKTVTLELRLPGGLKVKQTLKLARARR